MTEIEKRVWISQVKELTDKAGHFVNSDPTAKAILCAGVFIAQEIRELSTAIRDIKQGED